MKNLYNKIGAAVYDSNTPLEIAMQNPAIEKLLNRNPESFGVLHNTVCATFRTNPDLTADDIVVSAYSYFRNY